MSARFVSNRILFIDIARFYAIALVFYGHFIEELMLLKNPVAASQYKFIYSFHMVLFIVLAGYVANDVVILFASHGHMLLFPLTAIAGCALVLLVAGITRRQKTIVWLGQNTLILMCLNGIFYHYINPATAKWVMANLSHSAIGLSIISCAMTIASLAL